MKFENIIKPNEVNASYLFLGIGGCGSEIIRRVAKRCHPAERENISFVCMDTDVNDLKRIKDELPFIRTIQTSTPQTVGSFLDNDDDARKNWFPKSAVMYDKTMSEGAGQVRAISRLAFDATIKTGNIRPLYDGIDELFRKSGKEMKQSMRCIIASTSSGGTGSGMILPIAMFVRDYVKTKYPNAALLTRALLLLPETLDSVIVSQTERNSQARNGYATIKELNAFMEKGSGFVDLDPELKQYAELGVNVPIAGSDKLKFLSNLPIDFCFLMDGQDAEDSTLTSYEQYKEQAAIALYEQNIGPMQRKAASTEDNIIKELEKSKGRNRFGGVGVSIIKYPYERIVDYIACDLAMDSIGGEGESAKWTKYDKQYDKFALSQKKQGIPSSQIPLRSTEYPKYVQSAHDNFSKDIQNVYLSEFEPKVDAYIESLFNYAKIQANEYLKDAEVNEIQIKNVNDLKKFVGDLQNRYTCVVEEDKNGKPKIKSVVERSVEGVYSNTDVKTLNQKEAHGIESLFKFADGSITHPCATRCYLYALQEKLKEKINEQRLAGKREEVEDAWRKQKTKFGKTESVGFKDLVNNYNAVKGTKKIEIANVNSKKSLGDFADTLDEYLDELVKQSAAESALAYVMKLSEEFENFFAKFEDKVKHLEREKTDIVSELKYKNGNAELNVCSEKEVLDKISRIVVNNSSQNTTMLTPEINGAIFDQIKRNALYKMDAEAAGDDMMIENTSKDIFDETLLGYFKKQIMDNVDAIVNVDNIIEAIALEYRIVEENKSKKLDTAFIFNQKDAEAYIKRKLETGARIAAPSIQRMRFEEPREISRCAYHVSLLDDRKFPIKSILEMGDSCENVSPYEIRFYNALYNITPDKLKKFAAPYETETGHKDGGVYFKAYHEYSHHIGPDSTKNAAMSTHIDKRWDSIKEMPELDEEYQKHIVNDIHKSFIYGIVHNAIQHKPLSNKVHGKSIYTYCNSEDRYEDLIVPNGTLCDEFYEILDALYINAKVVEDINCKIKCKKRGVSIMKNCNYEGTEFFKDMASYNIVDYYAGKTVEEKTGEEIEKIVEKIEKCKFIKYKFESWIKEPELLSNEKEMKILKEIAPDISSNPTKANLTAAKEAFDMAEDTRYVENETSLFAIPMIYYYSLPNASRYVSEINALVDAVIDVFRDEYSTWEKEEDIKFVLCDRLINEFNLLEKNYKQLTEMKVPENIEENEVIDIIRRRIQDELQTAPEPEDYESLLDEIMKNAIR